MKQQGRLRRLFRRLKGSRPRKLRMLRSNLRQSLRHHMRGQEVGHLSRMSPIAFCDCD
jgi:hypothetical protein